MGPLTRFERELEEQWARIERARWPDGSEHEQDLVQEKFSDAKAAFARLRHHGEEALTQLVESRDAVWCEFERHIHELRRVLDESLRTR